MRIECSATTCQTPLARGSIPDRSVRLAAPSRYLPLSPLHSPSSRARLRQSSSMPDLPTGTVTFLFTDVEQSTRLLGELGADAYGQALEEHRKRLREAFQAGYEVDTQGDSLFYAFERVDDAVVAAAAGQRALDGLPLHVRMGIHTGQPT